MLRPQIENENVEALLKLFALFRGVSDSQANTEIIAALLDPKLLGELLASVQFAVMKVQASLESAS